eukprot:1577325-Alexandrium_andersonii.AAC.1
MRATLARRSQWAPGRPLPSCRGGCWATGGPFRARHRARGFATLQPMGGGSPSSARCTWVG